MELAYQRVDSPIGELLIAAAPQGICRLSFPVSLSGNWFPWFSRRFGGVPRLSPHPWLQLAQQQLGEYFEHRRRTFEVPLDLQGTAFQRRVWDALLNIPYGNTVTYGDLAARLGNPRAARAVGSAVGDNPVAVIIPCHRVVGFSGRLVGFGGGIEAKEQLLELEGARIRFGAG